MKMIGLDVSSWQGRPNWAKVKADPAGYKFVILRCHQKTGTDASFEYNYKNANENGFRIGVYKYSYAMNAKEAKAEAKGVLKTLKGKAFDLPVFYDLEDDTQANQLTKEQIEEIAEAFLTTVSDAGYAVGIYCNMYWYTSLLTDNLKKKYDFWIARLSDTKPENVKNLLAWQNTWSLKVNGIEGEVDGDYYFGDIEEEEVDGKKVTAEDVIGIMRNWIGLSRENGTHKEIIDTYNSYSPLPLGYEVSYTDDYCDTTVSSAFIKAGNVDIIGGIECGVERHVSKFIKEGIWVEDGTITPEVGDIVVYNWDSESQPNDGFSDHIGIVDTVGKKRFSTIEGNISGGMVGRRSVNIGDAYIRGFAKPKYAKSKEETVPKTITDIANEVIDGLWGEGIDKVNALFAAGHNPGLVMAKVYELLNPTPVKEEVDSSNVNGISKVPKFTGRVTSSVLNVRTWAGICNPKIRSYPTLSKNNLVDVCDTVLDSEGYKWYYIRIANQFYGFVDSEYIDRV